MFTKPEMIINRILSESDLPQGFKSEDAVFIGWQSNFDGGAFPLFTIIARGHPSYGSTVSDMTLRALKLKIPQTTPLKNR
jgi:hypothetical protein